MKGVIMIDEIDLQIIQLLKENSRLQWKEIGEIIHMTGQGVAARIRKMEELGIIEKYTLQLNNKQLGMELTGFITVHMTSTDYKSFVTFLQMQDGVVEAHSTSGGGCFLLKVVMQGTEQLNQFLELLLKYAGYSLSLSIDKIKG
jgi:Lrp/AsnC family leucine-responsive transcriptional regulator